MKIDTALFGAQEIDPNTLIEFPQGVPGFESCLQFKLMHQEGEEKAVCYLQSIADAEVMFSLSEPNQFGLDYEITLSDEDVELIDYQEDDVILTLLPLIEEKDPNLPKIRANIHAPFIINSRSRLGLQKNLLGPQGTITIKG